MIRPRMPTPIGHSIAGLAVAWGTDAWHAARDPSGEPVISRTGIIVCAGLAAAPDLDLFVRHAHRTFSHSLTAVAVVMIMSIVVTGRVTRRLGGRSSVWLVAACTVAYASHILLDWLATDPHVPRGLQILWPFSDRWFISELDIFRGTARQRILSPQSIRTNMLAVLQEIAILGTIAWVMWSVRIKALARLPAEMAGRNHPPQ
jgi:membrane-bound metal-dependent hydrolase YbcI (DUF457 family)